MKVKEMHILSAIIERKLKKQFLQITKVKITSRFYQEGVYTNIEFQISAKFVNKEIGIFKPLVSLEFFKDCSVKNMAILFVRLFGKYINEHLKDIKINALS